MIGKQIAITYTGRRALIFFIVKLNVILHFRQPGKALRKSMLRLPTVEYWVSRPLPTTRSLLSNLSSNFPSKWKCKSGLSDSTSVGSCAAENQGLRGGSDF